MKSTYLGLNDSILVPTILESILFFHFDFNKPIDLVYLTEGFCLDRSGKINVR